MQNIYNFKIKHPLLSPLVYTLIFILLSLIGIKLLRIKDKIARELEILGYVILFVVMIWQFVLNDIGTHNDDTEKENIQNKLNYIWEEMHDSDTDFSLPYWYKTPNFSRPELYEYDEGMVDNNEKNKEDYMKLISSFLTFSSTILIAIGRFQELKKTKNLPKAQVLKETQVCRRNIKRTRQISKRHYRRLVKKQK